MSNFGIEITEMVMKELLRRILTEHSENGRYLSDSWSKDLSIWERRSGPARGVAYRKLPDPNPHQRRSSDSKAA